MSPHRWSMSVVAVGALAAGASLVAATPAAAHTIAGSGPTNFLTEIDRVEPPVEGVDARVLEFGNQLEVTNRTGTDLVVLGYQGEPYLRIGAEGVFENARSPATYLNADRQGQTPVPATADAGAAPAWERVSGGDTARWHDHRIHWMGSDDPPSVRRDPGRAQVVNPRWLVPLQLGDRSIEVSGTLRWVPGPRVWPWLAAAAALAGVVVAAAWRWGAPVLAVLSLVLVVGDVAHAAGLAWAPGVPGSPVGRFVGGSVVPAVGWGAGVAAVVALARGRPTGLLLAALAGFSVFLIGGIGDIAALGRSQVLFAWGDDAARAAVAASIGLGAGVTAAALLTMRRTTGSFLGA